MNHVSSPVLRRLQDEPLSVPDSARRHLGACARCQASNSKIAQNAALAARVLAAPAAGPDDTSRAWARLQANEPLGDRATGRRGAPAAGRAAVRVPRPRPRIASLSLGTGTIAVAGVLVAGTGAAVALTTVYAPTHVAPVRVSQGDTLALATIASIGGTGVTDGLPPAGQQLPFGDLSWTSAGKASPVPSVAQARTLTGLPLTSPRTVPAGVGSPRAVVVQPKVTVTVTFDASAGGGVGGSTLVITGGPGALVQNGGGPPGGCPV